MTAVDAITGRVRLGPRAWLARQLAWDTNGVLIALDEYAIVSGPGFVDADAIALAGAAHGGPALELLLTHVDFDHLRAIGSHPRAGVLASSLTAAALADVALVERYAKMAADWGSPWDFEPRVDRVFEPGEPVCGGRVGTFAVPGHTTDSVAYVVEREGILLPGDYLSATTYPMMTAAIDDAIATHGVLLERARSEQCSLVVPGHGPAMDALGAAAIALEDRDYLERVRDEVAQAVDRSLTESETLMRAYGRVDPPRRPRGGFEALDMHAVNIRRAYAHLRAPER